MNSEHRNRRIYYRLIVAERASRKLSSGANCPVTAVAAVVVEGVALRDICTGRRTRAGVCTRACERKRERESESRERERPF